MRRFRLTGPEVLIGGRSFERISGTILVSEGKVAVIADDDPRGDDLARSPYLEEVDENDQPVKNAEARAPETSEVPADEEPTETEGSTSRRKKPPADSGGV